MAIVKAVEKEIKSHDYVYSSLSYVLSPETEPLPPKGGRFNQRLKPPKVG